MKVIETNFIVYVYIKEREEWKPITYPGIDGGKYEVSSYGNVRNIKSGRLLKPYPDGKNRYMYLSFAIIGNKIKRRNVSIHRLVAWHFVEGYTKERNEVNHIDNNERNSYYENLEWCTHAENNQHMDRQDRNHKQKESFKKRLIENNPNKNYTDEIVIEICHYLNEGVKAKNIAEIISSKTGLSADVKLKNYIYGIKSGYNRSDLTTKYLK